MFEEYPTTIYARWCAGFPRFVYWVGFYRSAYLRMADLDREGRLELHRRLGAR